MHLFKNERTNLYFLISNGLGICGSCAMNIGGKNTLACICKIERDSKDLKVTKIKHNVCSIQLYICVVSVVQLDLVFP